MTIDPYERDQNRRTIIGMLETTPATVARPSEPEASPETPTDIDFDWRPQPLMRGFQIQRTWRWSIIVAAVVLGALALVGVQLLVTVPEEKADERRVEYAQALDEYEEALEALAVAPTPSDPESLTAFTSATAQFGAVVRADLPGVVPFLPVGPIEELRPARSEMLALLDQAEKLVDDLGAASTYRDATTRILALPLLPTTAPTELIDAAAGALADMQANGESGYSRLDDDPTFAAYRDRVKEGMDALSDWTDRYLLALRRGEAEVTAALIVEMQARASLANAEIEKAVSELDAAAVDTIAEMQAALEEARIKLS